jgi:AcrR family transcriptional regulator
VTAARRRTSAETREHVLGVARDLFYWRGVRATGVDMVASEAGIAPTTLYRLFASKDDLVAAYVEREARGYRAWFDAAVATAPDDPRAQVLAVFDALAEMVRPEQCRGCPFQMALAELPEPGSPAREHAVAVKAWVRGRFRAIARATPAGDPDALGDRLALLMEGVYGSVMALGDAGPARQARATAELLLDAPSPRRTA